MSEQFPQDDLTEEPGVGVEGEAADDAAGETYVMVPVRAEMRQDVEHYIARLRWAGSEVGAWEVDELVELLAALDEASLRLLRTVASAKAADRDIEDERLASSLGISTRELLGMIREINDFGPPGRFDLVAFRRVPLADGAGYTRWVTMLDEHVPRFLEAEDLRRNAAGR